jgi:YVTN family beta-propeller protein
MKAKLLLSHFPLMAALCLGASGGHAATPPNPSWVVGTQPYGDGSWVVQNGQIITPAGAHIILPGSRTNRVAIRPDGKTAATLNVSSSNPVRIVDLTAGTELNKFKAPTSNGSVNGLIYSADGNTLFAAQETGFVLIATVAADGTLSSAKQVKVTGQTGGNPYPNGLALSGDGKTLYVALNLDNSIGVIDVASATFTKRIPVGNAPRNIAIVGTTAYVTNEGGRTATASDFTVGSGGTRIVADTKTGAAATATVSVVDLVAQTKTADINVGSHPTGVGAHAGLSTQ